jgi:hypothetical protein
MKIPAELNYRGSTGIIQESNRECMEKRSMMQYGGIVSKKTPYSLDSFSNFYFSYFFLALLSPLPT